MAIWQYEDHGNDDEYEDQNQNDGDLRRMILVLMMMVMPNPNLFPEDLKFGAGIMITVMTMLTLKLLMTLSQEAQPSPDIKFSSVEHNSVPRSKAFTHGYLLITDHKSWHNKVVH